MFSTCILLGVTFVLFSAAEDVKVLKKHTYYNSTEMSVRFDEVNLEEIEVEAFKDSAIPYLMIARNPLTELKNGIFSNVSTYMVLLMKNNISTIEPGTFHEMHLLEDRDHLVLSLNHNNLTSIRKGVFTETKFYLLYISYNKISYIEPGSFDDMVYLQILHLTENLLETVTQGVFQNIGPHGLNLWLKKNKIKVVDPYAFENTTLEVLDLENNPISGLDRNYFKNADILHLRAPDYYEEPMNTSSIE